MPPTKIFKKIITKFTHKQKIFLANCENALQRQMSYTQVRQETFSNIYKYRELQLSINKKCSENNNFFAEILMSQLENVLQCFPKTIGHDMSV